MKTSAIKSAESPNDSPNDTVDSPHPSKITEHLVSVPLRNPTRPEPANHFFAVVPDVNTESLLCQASETLASLSVMATDLARELEGPRRHVILAIQQLSALGELLVNRALDNLEPPRGSSEGRPTANAE
ncbi:DUF6124 family protein [Pseudomonas sp. ANT_H12B]|uniref:DUF6124 family protein n=1 Tax=Pseudomonas sp. ANT_H12B TaxID=2597348 RepID=UPI0011F0463F|nr:DUF6124 family protein [Pseudomonas sp. ANT_H12B]KAA0959608.1 hypothetical protein FQ185_26035 [Pseudomonas sp. ANT_H12B]